jgi:cyclopropane-fatty-acyl-phospholipid synthase
MSPTETSATSPALDVPAAVPSAAPSAWADRVFARLARPRLVEALGRWSTGRLTIHFPDGTAVAAGAPDADLHGSMHIDRDAFFRHFALRGDLGAGESYMAGDWRADDLARVVELILRNPAVALDSTLTRLINLPNDWLHRRRQNTKSGSRRNIRAHYDLSNDLFQTFLDPSMAYSSAVFPTGTESLDEAQQAKFRAWGERLQVTAADHVLEIGSGWGGLAIHLARTYGCRVTSITVSEEQLVLARQRVREAGVEDRVEIVLRDYRDVTGQYSRVVSIEMIEAVGREFWPAFFSKIDQVLAPGGRAGIQAITMVDHHFDEYVRHCDWIQKYIFPGGLLPCLREVCAVTARHTRLGVIGVEDRPLDYARTLQLWRQRFMGQSERVRALGFDDRFVRMWEFYLATCEGAFRTRNLGLLHLTLARTGEDLH